MLNLMPKSIAITRYGLFPGLAWTPIRLDQEGVAASAGSACQSGAADVSHVLSAMGFDAARARECFRFTFGWTTLADDGDTAADAVLRAIGGER